MSTAPARIPKAERTRRQILAAAERRFAEAGFESTRLDDIADDIGMVGSALLSRIAALPQFVADLPEDHLSAERMELLESDAVAIAERLLGTSGPRPV